MQTEISMLKQRLESLESHKREILERIDVLNEKEQNTFEKNQLSSEILELLSKDKSKCSQIKYEIKEVKQYVQLALTNHLSEQYWHAKQAIERFNVITDLKYFNLNGTQKKKYSKNDLTLNQLLEEFLHCFETL